MQEISVIIPTLNEEKLLPRLMESLKKQKGVKLEIIVADADSKDKTKEIAKKYNAKIVKGGLPAVGRNIGASHATKEQIVFLDADVFFDDHFLKNTLSEMKKRKLGLATVTSNPDSNKFSDKLLFKLWDFWLFLMQKIDPHAPGYCIFSTKEMHEKINGFDERLTLAEDANYVKRASKETKFGVIKNPINVSARRLDTEGRLKFPIKMISCGFYRALIGEPYNDKFNYKFGEHKN